MSDDCAVTGIRQWQWRGGVLIDATIINGTGRISAAGGNGQVTRERQY